MSEKRHPPAFQFYPNDFASDGIVESMTTEAVGAYILLLCKAWYEKPVGSIPNDDRILARWSRLDADRWSECKNSVLSAFSLGTDSRWHQKRLRAEFDAQCRRSKERSEAGKEGAKKRWNGNDGIAKPKQSDGSANDLPIANNGSSSSATASNENIEKDAGAKPTRLFPMNFDPWWLAFQQLWEDTRKRCPEGHMTEVRQDDLDDSLRQAIEQRRADAWWERKWREALERFPLKMYLDKGTIVSPTAFTKAGFVKKVLDGDYDNVWSDKPSSGGKKDRSDKAYQTAAGDNFKDGW